MELKLLYLCDGPYHSVLFQTHLWLGILYSFLLQVPGGWGTFIPQCSPSQLSRTRFPCLLPHPALLLYLWRRWHAFSLLSGKFCVCMHTHTPHSPWFPVHPSAQTAFLKEAFVATPDQNRLSCFTPSQTLCFSFRALVCDYLSLSLSLSIKSGIIVSPLYPQPWQNAWYTEGVLEWINKSSMPICYMDEWMVVWSVIVPKSKRSC